MYQNHLSSPLQKKKKKSKNFERRNFKIKRKKKTKKNIFLKIATRKHISKSVYEHIRLQKKKYMYPLYFLCQKEKRKVLPEDRDGLQCCACSFLLFFLSFSFFFFFFYILFIFFIVNESPPLHHTEWYRAKKEKKRRQDTPPCKSMYIDVNKLIFMHTHIHKKKKRKKNSHILFQIDESTFTRKRRLTIRCFESASVCRIRQLTRTVQITSSTPLRTPA